MSENSNSTPEQNVNEIPVEPTPVASTPVAPTPAAPTPVEPTPVAPTPAASTPVAPTPVAPTPVAPTPVAPTPVEPTPVAPTPVAPTPVAPIYNSNSGENTLDETPMKMTDWLLTMLALLIPCGVGIVLYFIWAFGKTGNVNRRNFCRAYLIIVGGALLLWLVIFLIFGAAIMAGFGSLSSYSYY